MKKTATKAKTIKYEPYEGIRNFYLLHNFRKDLDLLCYREKGKDIFCLEIAKKAHLPRSGVLICQSVKAHLKGKRVLDLGTGETGIVAIYSLKNGARSVVGSDINKKAIKTARLNGKINKVDDKIQWVVSDLFNNIYGKFDLIICNPPQLLGIDRGKLDSWELIKKIIHKSPDYLNDRGKLIILAFDFLGINESFGPKTSLFEVFRENNFYPSILSRKRKLIRKEERTYRVLSTIRKLYPRYRFRKDKKGNLYHEVIIVKGVLKNKG